MGRRRLGLWEPGRGGRTRRPAAVPGLPRPVRQGECELHPVRPGMGRPHPQPRPGREFTSTRSVAVRVPAFVCCGLTQGQQPPEVGASHCKVCPWAASRGLIHLTHLSAARPGTGCVPGAGEVSVSSPTPSLRQPAAGTRVIPTSDRPVPLAELAACPCSRTRRRSHPRPQPPPGPSAVQGLGRSEGDPLAKTQTSTEPFARNFRAVLA